MTTSARSKATASRSARPPLHPPAPPPAPPPQDGQPLADLRVLPSDRSRPQRGKERLRRGGLDQTGRSEEGGGDETRKSYPGDVSRQHMGDQGGAVRTAQLGSEMDKPLQGLFVPDPLEELVKGIRRVSLAQEIQAVGHHAGRKSGGRRQRRLGVLTKGVGAILPPAKNLREDLGDLLPLSLPEALPGPLQMSDHFGEERRRDPRDFQRHRTKRAGLDFTSRDL